MSVNLPLSLAKLSLQDYDSLSNMPHGLPNGHGAAAPEIPHDIAATLDPAFDRLKAYARSLPYSIESNAQIQHLLDLFAARISQCIEAKDYDPGLLQWDSMLNYWFTLKYPLPKQKRIALAKLYFEICVAPGMPTSISISCADTLQLLLRSKRKLTIEDMRLPWKPIYEVLSSELFLARRQFEISATPYCMGFIADVARRFFHPAAIDEMLKTFLPLFDGTVLNSVLSSQYYMLTFLPLSHPQSYLPMLFRLWESINSYLFDERMLHFLSQLAEMHVDPNVSDPSRIASIPDDTRSSGEGRPYFDKHDLKRTVPWNGIFKDVGIFTDDEWNFIMCKCLASMEIPLADAGSLTTGPSADNEATFEIGRLPKPTWRIFSLARLIVYSMVSDGPVALGSNYVTPFASGMATPVTPGTPEAKAGDYFGKAPPLLKRATTFHIKRSYLAGSKALDSLARMIASCESFFHPTNSGAWTTDLSAFIKYVVYEFNKRWYQERKSDCKTPHTRRLTALMKRELVKSLRTVCLLAMFSSNANTVSNIQSCLKSLTIMEPDLILHPILERAIPSLESLIETERTIAVIKALGAVAPSLVSREVYHRGSKHLLQILELLLPGIDLNDPSKTLCTTSFLIEVSQYIKFGDLTNIEAPMTAHMDDPGPGLIVESPVDGHLPDFTNDAVAEDLDLSNEPRLTEEEEDVLLKETTASFADWVSSFIRRVILLLENLPEESPNGSNSSNDTEVQVVDAVMGACSQICVHLSEPMFDMVLKMVFEYATSNVRSNAVRAVHQLVECVANANPAKTLARFVPFCDRVIRSELEHGASSTRTTSSSAPIPSDTTLHWNLAILRGAMYNDGKAVLRHGRHVMPLLQVLHDKTFSKRGFSWTGKLLSSVLLTLTHTYPLENKFVNPEEWEGDDFKRTHHMHWGKMYKPEEVKISWHIPDDEEIAFALKVFRELVEPTLALLENLIEDEKLVRDAEWRNDFCRHLSLVRSAFSGTPTLAKEIISSELVRSNLETSDIMDELPEMIASVEPIGSGFVLTDPEDPRYQYYMNLRRRFAAFLHTASVSLRQQGEENTVDAVYMLVRSIRTYMLEYGDSRDNYYTQLSSYNNEINLARYYANQKVWPRAIYIRRARLYHSARLHWNSLERARGEIEDALIDDTTEWAMWHYAIIRQTSQSLLDSLSSVFDGIRRRSLPILYSGLCPGVDDDRMKGALWTLSSATFSKYAMAEATVTTKFAKMLFACQHNEKPSIQDCVGALAENCLNSLVEPCYAIFDTQSPAVDRAVRTLRCLLPDVLDDSGLVSRCAERRHQRTQSTQQHIRHLTDVVLEIANSSETHWKYSIVALRVLRTLIRRDAPIIPDQLKYFALKTHDNHPTMRYYAQRALMKALRYVKLRTTARTTEDILLRRNHNPLRRRISVTPIIPSYTEDFLQQFRTPLDWHAAQKQPVLQDKVANGWLVWNDELDLFLAPPASGSVFIPWEAASFEALEVLRTVVMDPSYWKQLTTHLTEENNVNTVTNDNISSIKSIFQILEDEPLSILKPILEQLTDHVEQHKQRGAAELIAGILGASKHWALDKQEKLWAWIMPLVKKCTGASLKPDALMVWTTFFEYMFYRRDPRRVHQLVEYIVNEYKAVDSASSSSFDAVRCHSFFQSLSEEVGWRFTAWTEETLHRAWMDISCEYDEVRDYIADYLEFSGKIKWRPKPSSPTVEVFVRECRTLPLDFDIMDIHGTYHVERVQELTDRFATWREERLPGARAFQSTYDRVGVTVCKWLFRIIHDLRAACVYDYILPLMPEFFRFSELNDNDDLANRANVLLVRMCGATVPKNLVNPILDAIFEAITSSPSWRVRLKALPLVQVFYFRQVPLISEEKALEIAEVLCNCLEDEVIEVREMAAITLSGILRLSPRRSIIALKDRFVRATESVMLPHRTATNYPASLRALHSSLLGICALIDSFPYTIEKWMPELLTTVLAEHAYDPVPVSTTVQKCANNFKKTHQDTWHEDSKKFTEEQLSTLSTLLTGSSYYA